MKTIDAIKAFHAIQSLIDEASDKPAAFSYALIRNKRTLDATVQQYNARLSEHQDPDLERLLSRWREIAPTYAQRNETGEITLDPTGNIVIARDRVIDYNLACEEIMKEDEDFRRAFDKRTAVVDRLQQQDADVQIYPIALSLFPENTDPKIIEVLFPFIDGNK